MTFELNNVILYVKKLRKEQTKKKEKKMENKYNLQWNNITEHDWLDTPSYSADIKLPFFESLNIYNHEEELKKEFAFSFVYDKASLPNQINDQLAIGSDNAMNKYMNCIHNIHEAINYMWTDGFPEYMIKVPESVFTIQLQRRNCKYKQLTGTNSFGNIKTILNKNGKKWRNKGHNSISI